MSAKRPPRYRDIPVTSTTRAIGSPWGLLAAERCGRAARAATPQRAGARGASLLVAALVTRLAQQLAVLLLGHPLAALLDDGAHVSSQSVQSGSRSVPTGAYPAQRDGASRRSPPAAITRCRRHPRRRSAADSRARPAPVRGRTGPPAPPAAPRRGRAGTPSSSTRA